MELHEVPAGGHSILGVRDDATHQVGLWRHEILAHPALAALRAFDAHLPALDRDVAKAFLASLYAFNRATPAGIAFLAARWADHLQLTEPLVAHRVAASILAAGVDEFGLAGTRPHVELFMEFAARWGVTPSEVIDRQNAVVAACELGDAVERWYRLAPLTEAMAIHFVSEETSTEEFGAWFRIFPDADYTRVHAELEPGHSNDAGACLARHLAAHPDQIAHAHRVIAPYLALYGAMWAQLGALVADDRRGLGAADGQRGIGALAT